MYREGWLKFPPTLTGKLDRLSFSDLLNIQYLFYCPVRYWFVSVFVLFVFNAYSSEHCTKKVYDRFCQSVDFGPSTNFSENGDVIYSLNLQYGLFIVRKTSIFVHGSWYRVINKNRYGIGSGISYWFGPWNTYYLAPEYRFSFLSEYDPVRQNGFLHGPGIFVYTRVWQFLLIGLGARYSFIEINKQMQTDFDWHLHIRMVL
ncbi:MAG: hypothetical protein D6767_04780 [Candidatus Hydrogenedentota bacterium]|nr:MAG: hypothetical protein D6767_04780 [Candidatus Hydrogenedentota bacterium]